MAGKGGMAVERHVNSTSAYITGDMTATQIAEAFEIIPFERHSSVRILEIDADARDFIVRAIRAWSRSRGG